MQLQHTPPTQLRRLFGRLTVTALVAACGYGALAANAAVESTDRYMVNMKLSAGGETSTPALLVQKGVPAAVASTGKDGVWRTELLVPVGESAAVAVDDQFKLQLAVSTPRD